jgi:hypothetical protein
MYAFVMDGPNPGKGDYEDARGVNGRRLVTELIGYLVHSFIF